MDSNKIILCHVCGKKKVPYIVFLTDSIMGYMQYEQAREGGEICERCDKFYAMTGELREPTEKEFETAKKACEFARNMFMERIVTQEDLDRNYNLFLKGRPLDIPMVWMPQLKVKIQHFLLQSDLRTYRLCRYCTKEFQVTGHFSNKYCSKDCQIEGYRLIRNKLVRNYYHRNKKNILNENN